MFERRREKEKTAKKRTTLISEGRRNDRWLLLSPLPLLLFSTSTSTSFLTLSLSSSLFLPFFSMSKSSTEDNVDAVVEGGAVRAVVPLLTMFKVDEGRGVSR